MDIVTTLSNKLLQQEFVEEQEQPSQLAEYQYIARGYAKLENAIAVLSDLKSNTSYLYYGALADVLGISTENRINKIDSIWEEQIFNSIHPEDLHNKYAMEVQFFQLLKTLPVAERVNYQAISKIRMLDSTHQYIAATHRIFYVCSCPNGSLWLTLCLYHFSYDQQLFTGNNIIVNSSTGSVREPDIQQHQAILTEREREVLRLIQKGKISKEIAALLHISIHTVNRHRQNMLEKLLVSNSMEACRVAELMKLI